MSGRLRDNRTLETFNVLNDYDSKAMYRCRHNSPNAFVIRSLDQAVKSRSKPIEIR